MTTIASLFVDVGANIGGFMGGMSNVESRIDGVSQRIAGIGQSMQRAGAQMTLLTAPMTLLGTQGLTTATQFESSMAEIGARAGLTADELAGVSAFAIQMGSDTAFSATEAADAFLQLLTSGQTVEQAYATLPAVLDAAAASGENLGATADGITDIMAAFSLPVENAEGVVNSLAQAAGASSADMGSLTAGFQNVGNVADQFGLSVDETAAILATFSENGIKGAEAGTQLRSMLLNMSRPTADTVQAWDDLGTSLYDAEGNVRPLSDVITDISAAMEDMPTEEQNEIMHALAGSYGIMGLSALMGSISMDNMLDSMHDSATASDVAEQRMDTFAGEIDSLGGSIDSLMINQLTPLMDDFLGPMVEKLTDVVNGITDWANENPELASTITKIVGALIVAGPTLVIAGTAISAIGTVAGVAGTALGLLLSPAILIGAAFAGILVAGGTLDDFLSDVQTSASEIGPAFQDVVNGIGELIDGDPGAIDDLAAGFTGLGTALLRIPSSLVLNLAEGVGNLIGVDVAGGLDALVAGVDAAGKALSIVFFNIKNNIARFFLETQLTILEKIGGLRQTILDATGGSVDIAPDLEVDASGIIWEISRLDFIESLQTQLNTQIGEGDIDPMVFSAPIEIQGQMINPETMFSEADLAEAMGPVSRDTIQRALDTALTTGDETAFEALVPLATELGIDVADEVNQLQASLDEATATMVYETAMTADLTIFPGRIDVTRLVPGVSQALDEAAGANSDIRVGPNGVPSFQTGGLMPETGLAFLHRGERVLNPSQTRTYDAGMGGGGNTYIIYGSSPYEVAEMVTRANRDRGR